MLQKSTLLVMGRLGRPHGVRGYLKVISFTSPPEQLFSYPNWYVGHDNQWTPFDTHKLALNSEGMLVKLPHCVDREQAKLCTGQDIAIPRELLPILPVGQYYWSDLVGLSVINQDGINLGVVSHLFETGSNDVLVIKGEKEHLIPYLPGDYVLGVDLEKKLIHVQWDTNF